MKTIGQILSQARKRKKTSIRKISQETKIKEEFLQAIEDERWDKLPDFAVTAGFVQSFAKAVGVKPEFALAVLRRDIPKETRDSMSFDLDIGRKKFWTPKMTTALIIFFTFLVLGGYLVSQYLVFVKPPPLEVFSPQQGQEMLGSKVEILGKTSPEASVRINNQPVLVDDNGNFKGSVTLLEGVWDIVVESKSRSGKTTTKTIRVIVKS